MGAAKYINASFQKSAKDRSETYRKRIRIWKKQNTVMRTNPTNPVRARALGYKATKEFIVARVRMKKGNRVRPKADLGRKPGKTRKRVEPGRALSWYAMQKSMRRFPNFQPINCYWAGEDGSEKFFEVIMKKI